MITTEDMDRFSKITAFRILADHHCPSFRILLDESDSNISFGLEFYKESFSLLCYFITETRKIRISVWVMHFLITRFILPLLLSFQRKLYITGYNLTRAILDKAFEGHCECFSLLYLIKGTFLSNNSTFHLFFGSFRFQKA